MALSIYIEFREYSAITGCENQQRRGEIRYRTVSQITIRLIP